MKARPTLFAVALLTCAVPLFAAFQGGTSFPLIINGVGMPIVVDFNRDGLDDVLRSGRIYLNNGSGFTALGDLGVPSGVAAEMFADFNGDGILDLVGRSNNSSFPASIMPGAPVIPGSEGLFLGTGGLNFTPLFTIPGQHRVIYAGDLDGDGKADFVFYRINRDPANTVRVLSTTIMVERSNGDGSFEKTYEATINGQYEPQGIVAADLNRDGRPDLAIRYPDDLFTIVSRGNSGFGQPISRYLPMRFGIFSMLSGDVDGDGNPDIAIGGNDKDIRVLFGDGHGNFLRSARAIITGTEDKEFNLPKNIAAINYSSTTRVDIAGGVYEGAIVVFSWIGGELREVSRTATDLHMPLIQAGAFTNGGRRDLYVFATFGNTDRIFYADGSASTAAAALPGRARSVRTAGAGTMALSVSKRGECLTEATESWRFEREGMFARDAAHGIEAVMEGDMLFLRLAQGTGEPVQGVLSGVEPNRYMGYLAVPSACGSTASVTYDARVQQ